MTSANTNEEWCKGVLVGTNNVMNVCLIQMLIQIMENVLASFSRRCLGSKRCMEKKELDCVLDELHIWCTGRCGVFSAGIEANFVLFVYQ